VFEYAGQTFQPRLRIYSEKWTLLKPLMWNPFTSSQKTYIRTDFATDGIQANSLNVKSINYPTGWDNIAGDSSSDTTTSTICCECSCVCS
jgi:hypothetical protein